MSSRRGSGPSGTRAPQLSLLTAAALNRHPHASVLPILQSAGPMTRSPERNRAIRTAAANPPLAGHRHTGGPSQRHACKVREAGCRGTEHRR